MDQIDSLRNAVMRIDDTAAENRQRITALEERVETLDDSLGRKTERFRLVVEGNPDTGSPGLNERLARVETELGEVRSTLQRMMWVVIGAAGAFALFGNNGFGALLLRIFGLVP